MFSKSLFSSYCTSHSNTIAYLYAVLKMRGISTVILLFTFTSLWSQISNPGFEIAVSYPNNVGQFYLAEGWSNAGSETATPDYFHYFGGLGGDIPQTPVAVVNPSEGMGIMGMTVCGMPHTNRREYISNTFTTPLQSGQQYMLSFKITNGVLNEGSVAGLGVSNIGLCLSANPLVQIDNQPIEQIPQFELDTVLYSREWATLSFLFEADANFKFMTVGVFGNDDDLIFQVREGNPMFAYYFFDEFELVEINSQADLSQATSIPEIKAPVLTEIAGEKMPHDFFIPNAFSPNGDGENDYFLPIYSLHGIYVVEVFNRWGELIYSESSPDLGWDGRVADDKAKSGEYIWQITFDGVDANDVPQEKQIQGTVLLIR